jgi:hypothetical protein
MTLVRRLEIFRLLEELAQAPGWWQDLLRAWAPAGSALQGKRQLRVAIRNNYLNFYQRGQSIARVCVGRNNVVRLEIHKKYIYENVQGTGYARLAGSLISCRDGEFKDSEYVSGVGFLDWIERSRSISEKQVEKKLLEGFVAINPGVVDLEMGVPAWDKQADDAAKAGMPCPTRRFVPRMDLVLLEETKNAFPRVVFWEAKTTHDGRLRSRSDAEVIKQLKLYTNYLSHDCYAEGVKSAYRDACRILIKLHSLAATIEKSTLPPLADIIHRVAESVALPEIDPLPRLLVMAGKGVAVPKTLDGHLNKIREAGFPVLFAANGPVFLDRHALLQTQALEA